MPPLTAPTAAAILGAALVLTLVTVALSLLVGRVRDGRRIDTLHAIVAQLAARTPDEQPARPSPRPQQHRRPVVRHDAAPTRFDLRRSQP